MVSLFARKLGMKSFFWYQTFFSNFKIISSVKKCFQHAVLNNTRARVLSMLQVCSNNVKRCRYKTNLNFPAQYFCPKKELKFYVLIQQHPSLLMAKILMMGKFKLLSHWQNVWFFTKSSLPEAFYTVLLLPPGEQPQKL